jgi:hypothetical protein
VPVGPPPAPAGTEPPHRRVPIDGAIGCDVGMEPLTAEVDPRGLEPLTFWLPAKPVQTLH